MNIQTLIDYSKKNITPVKGNFPEKPYGVNSVIGWLKNGYRPTDIEHGGTIYKMYNKPDGYRYYSRSEVVPLTEDEKHQVAKIYGTEDVKFTINNKVETKVPKEKENVIKSKVFKIYKNLISIKVETTGFYPDEGDELLQIAIANKDGVLFDCYVKPHNKTEWKDSEKVHHITPETVKNAVYPEYIKPYVEEILNKADGIVSYNANFNFTFLEKCMGISIPNEKKIDAYEIFRVHKPSLISHRLGDAIKTYVNNEKVYQIYKKDEQSRRGGYDALCTLLIFKQMRSTIVKENHILAQKKQEQEEERGVEIDDR